MLRERGYRILSDCTAKQLGKAYKSKALRIFNYVAAQECCVSDYVAAANFASEELQISVLLDKIGVETLFAQLAHREYSTRCTLYVRSSR